MEWFLHLFCKLRKYCNLVSCTIMIGKKTKLMPTYLKELLQQCWSTLMRLFYQVPMCLWRTQDTQMVCYSHNYALIRKDFKEWELKQSVHTTARELLPYRRGQRNAHTISNTKLLTIEATVTIIAMFDAFPLHFSESLSATFVLIIWIFTFSVNYKISVKI